MNHAGIQYGQGSMASGLGQYGAGAEVSAVAGTANTTASLRQWRKKEAPLEKQQTSGEISSVATTESQGPIARVAPHAHYPQFNRLPTHQYQTNDYGSYQDLPPTPVKYSEIVEPPVIPSRIDTQLGPVITKTKEKEYLEMCNVQQPQINGMKHQAGYPNNLPPVIPQYKDHYVQKESQMHAYPSTNPYHPMTHNFKIPPNQYQRQYPVESSFHLAFFNERNVAPEPPQIYQMDQRAYQNQRIYRTNYRPPYHPPQMQNYAYRQPMQNQDPYRMHQYQQPIPKYPDYKFQMETERNITMRRMYSEPLVNYPRSSPPNFNQCAQMEYAQHYQNRRQIPPEYFHRTEPKMSYIQNQQMPDLVTDSSPKSSLKSFLENWNDDIPDIQESTKEIRLKDVEENLYILDSTEIPSEKIQQFIHLQVDKLPENIKGFLGTSTNGVIKASTMQSPDSVIKTQVPKISVISETKKFLEIETKLDLLLSPEQNSVIVFNDTNEKTEILENSVIRENKSGDLKLDEVTTSKLKTPEIVTVPPMINMVTVSSASKERDMPKIIEDANSNIASEIKDQAKLEDGKDITPPLETPTGDTIPENSILNKIVESENKVKLPDLDDLKEECDLITKIIPSEISSVSPEIKVDDSKNNTDQVENKDMASDKVQQITEVKPAAEEIDKTLLPITNLTTDDDLINNDEILKNNICPDDYLDNNKALNLIMEKEVKTDEETFSKNEEIKQLSSDSKFPHQQESEFKEEINQVTLKDDVLNKESNETPLKHEGELKPPSVILKVSSNVTSSIEEFRGENKTNVSDGNLTNGLELNSVPPRRRNSNVLTKAEMKEMPNVVSNNIFESSKIGPEETLDLTVNKATYLERRGETENLTEVSSSTIVPEEFKGQEVLKKVRFNDVIEYVDEISVRSSYKSDRINGEIIDDKEQQFDEIEEVLTNSSIEQLSPDDSDEVHKELNTLSDCSQSYESLSDGSESEEEIIYGTNNSLNDVSNIHSVGVISKNINIFSKHVDDSSNEPKISEDQHSTEKVQACLVKNEDTEVISIFKEFQKEETNIEKSIDKENDQDAEFLDQGEVKENKTENETESIIMDELDAGIEVGSIQKPCDNHIGVIKSTPEILETEISTPVTINNSEEENKLENLEEDIHGLENHNENTNLESISQNVILENESFSENVGLLNYDKLNKNQETIGEIKLDGKKSDSNNVFEEEEITEIETNKRLEDDQSFVTSEQSDPDDATIPDNFDNKPIQTYEQPDDDPNSEKDSSIDNKPIENHFVEDEIIKIQEDFEAEHSQETRSSIESSQENLPVEDADFDLKQQNKVKSNENIIIQDEIKSPQDEETDEKIKIENQIILEQVDDEVIASETIFPGHQEVTETICENILPENSITKIEEIDNIIHELPCTQLETKNEVEVEIEVEEEQNPVDDLVLSIQPSNYEESPNLLDVICDETTVNESKLEEEIISDVDVSIEENVTGVIITEDQDEDSPPILEPITTPPLFSGQESPPQICGVPENIQVTNAVIVEDNSVLLQIGGEVIEINVIQSLGKKIVSVVPYTDCTVVSENNNLEPPLPESQEENSEDFIPRENGKVLNGDDVSFFDTIPINSCTEIKNDDDSPIIFEDECNEVLVDSSVEEDKDAEVQVEENNKSSILDDIKLQTSTRWIVRLNHEDKLKITNHLKKQKLNKVKTNQGLKMKHVNIKEKFKHFAKNISGDFMKKIKNIENLQIAPRKFKTKGELKEAFSKKNIDNNQKVTKNGKKLNSPKTLINACEEKKSLQNKKVDMKIVAQAEHENSIEKMEMNSLNIHFGHRKDHNGFKTTKTLRNVRKKKIPKKFLDGISMIDTPKAGLKSIEKKPKKKIRFKNLYGPEEVSKEFDKPADQIITSKDCNINEESLLKSSDMKNPNTNSKHTENCNSLKNKSPKDEEVLIEKIEPAVVIPEISEPNVIKNKPIHDSTSIAKTVQVNSKTEVMEKTEKKSKTNIPSQNGAIEKIKVAKVTGKNTLSKTSASRESKKISKIVSALKESQENKAKALNNLNDVSGSFDDSKMNGSEKNYNTSQKLGAADSVSNNKTKKLFDLTTKIDKSNDLIFTPKEVIVNTCSSDTATGKNVIKVGEIVGKHTDTPKKACEDKKCGDKKEVLPGQISNLKEKPDLVKKIGILKRSYSDSPLEVGVDKKLENHKPKTNHPPGDKFKSPNLLRKRLSLEEYKRKRSGSQDLDKSQPETNEMTKKVESSWLNKVTTKPQPHDTKIEVRVRGVDPRTLPRSELTINKTPNYFGPLSSRYEKTIKEPQITPALRQYLAKKHESPKLENDIDFKKTHSPSIVDSSNFSPALNPIATDALFKKEDVNLNPVQSGESKKFTSTNTNIVQNGVLRGIKEVTDVGKMTFDGHDVNLKMEEVTGVRGVIISTCDESKKMKECMVVGKEDEELVVEDKKRESSFCKRVVDIVGDEGRVDANDVLDLSREIVKNKSIKMESVSDEMGKTSELDALKVMEEPKSIFNESKSNLDDLTKKIDEIFTQSLGTRRHAEEDLWRRFSNGERIAPEEVPKVRNVIERKNYKRLRLDFQEKRRDLFDLGELSTKVQSRNIIDLNDFNLDPPKQPKIKSIIDLNELLPNFGDVSIKSTIIDSAKKESESTNLENSSKDDQRENCDETRIVPNDNQSAFECLEKTNHEEKIEKLWLPDVPEPTLPNPETSSDPLEVTLVPEECNDESKTYTSVINSGEDLKLHIKKIEGKKSRKKRRFRNLHSCDSEPDEPPDYSVFESENQHGLPKLIIKRNVSESREHLQPVVRIERNVRLDNLAKRKRKA